MMHVPITSLRHYISCRRCFVTDNYQTELLQSKWNCVDLTQVQKLQYIQIMMMAEGERLKAAV